MKKFLISLFLILVIAIACVLIISNISIAGWTNKNYKNIEEISKQLDDKIETAKQKKEQEYQQTIDKLNEAITELKKTKEKYEAKMQYVSGNVELGVVQIKKYKIESLWIAIENYAKKENIELLLNVIENSSVTNSYNLEITVVGEYNNITDFIYDIEKDDELGFKIENFEMHQYGAKRTETESKQDEATNQNAESTTQNSNTGTNDGSDTTNEKNTENKTETNSNLVEATFVINNVEIDNAGGEFN